MQSRLSAPALLLALIVAAAIIARPVAAWTERVDPALLRATEWGNRAEFLVILETQADLSAAAKIADKTAKGAYVYQTLRDAAAGSQAPLVRYLQSQGATYRAYWVHNMVWVSGDRSLLRALALRPDVTHIYANESHQATPDPLPALSPTDSRTPDEVLPGLIAINAPQAWAAGYLGQGIVVGGQDTGYDWTHPTLKPQYRGWDGTTAAHDYNWHDAIHQNLPQTSPGNICGYDSPEPCDDDGHGTHTMGTMVGDDGAGTRYGVAPEAKWIGCRNMEDGWGSPVTYAECYEWFIAPYPVGGDKFTEGNPAKAPDVINNSWGCPRSEGCTEPDVLKDIVEAVTAAGIVTVHSAGNSGPSCGTVNTPAATYEASFTVAATYDDDTIVYFSSRGPTPGGLGKPDISAPGYNVLSALPGGGQGYSSGTSMAAPHVAGVVALALSADPSLRGNVEAIEARLTGAAEPLTTSEGCGGDSSDQVPNNTYGWGRIDAQRATQSQPMEHTLFMPMTAAMSGD